jgi:hypothetical protein
MPIFRRRQSQELTPARPPAREENVTFANDLLESEIAQRNATKDAQENTARGVIVAAGLVLTLLIGLANDAGLFDAKTSIVARYALIVTVVLGAMSAGCAMGVLWPRKYAKLAGEALDMFNDSTFLDQPTHLVAGMVVSSRIAFAKTISRQHERKARWLKWSFRFLAVAFVGLVVQGVVLAADPPSVKSPAPVLIIKRGTP